MMNPRAKEMYMMCTRQIVRAVDLIMVVLDVDVAAFRLLLILW